MTKAKHLKAAVGTDFAEIYKSKYLSKIQLADTTLIILLPHFEITYSILLNSSW